MTINYVSTPRPQAAAPGIEPASRYLEYGNAANGRISHAWGRTPRYRRIGDWELTALARVRSYLYLVAI